MLLVWDPNLALEPAHAMKLVLAGILAIPMLCPSAVEVRFLPGNTTVAVRFSSHLVLGHQESENVRKHKEETRRSRQRL